MKSLFRFLRSGRLCSVLVVIRYYCTSEPSGLPVFWYHIEAPGVKIGVGFGHFEFSFMRIKAGND